MNKNIALVVVVAILLIGAVVLLANKNSTQAPSTTSMEQLSPIPQAQAVSPTATETTMPSKGEVKEFTLEAGSFYYKPNTITVKKGDKVKITINSVDMMHNINVDEFDAHSDTAPAGKSATIEFTADKAGSFEFYCAVGQHRKMGQVGTLTVEE